MAALGLWSLVARLRGSIYEGRVLLWCSILMAPSGFAAVLAGWVTTEVGRQPWTVYGILTTAESVPPLAAPAVASSLVAFIVVYFAVFGPGTFYVLRLLARHPQARLAAALRPLRAPRTTPSPAMAAHRHRHPAGHGRPAERPAGRG